MYTTEYILSVLEWDQLELVYSLQSVTSQETQKFVQWPPEDKLHKNTNEWKYKQIRTISGWYVSE